MKTEALEAAFSVAMPDSALGEFMYMPAGVHRCDLKRGGKPLSVVVKVDATAAPAFDAAIELCVVPSCERQSRLAFAVQPNSR